MGKIRGCVTRFIEIKNTSERLWKALEKEVIGLVVSMIGQDDGNRVNGFTKSNYS